MKFILKMQSSHEDNTIVTHEFEAESLTTIIENVGLFLKGCGFYFDDIEVILNNDND